MGVSILSAEPFRQRWCLAPTFGRGAGRQMADEAHAGTEVAHAKGEGRVGRPGKGQ